MCTFSFILNPTLSKKKNNFTNFIVKYVWTDEQWLRLIKQSGSFNNHKVGEPIPSCRNVRITMRLNFEKFLWDVNYWCARARTSCMSWIKVLYKHVSTRVNAACSAKLLVWSTRLEMRNENAIPRRNCCCDLALYKKHWTEINYHDMSLVQCEHKGKPSTDDD